MNSKQLTTLKYFALGYSLKSISYKENVSLSSIKRRIKSLAKYYPQEFYNACGIRNSYKRAKRNLRFPISFEQDIIESESNIISVF